MKAYLLVQQYSYIDAPLMTGYHAIDTVPAYAKLPLERMGPKTIIKVLEQACADIEEIQRLIQS